MNEPLSRLMNFVFSVKLLLITSSDRPDCNCNQSETMRLMYGS